MTDLTKRLPIELLAEIVGYASALDILRFKQVKNRPFDVDTLTSTNGVHRSITTSAMLFTRHPYFNTR